MTGEEQDDLARGENFRLRVEEIIRDFMKDRELTVKEAEAIERALRNILEIVIAKRVGTAMGAHVKEYHSQWQIRGWGGVLKILSIAAALVGLSEVLKHFFGRG